MGKRLLVVDSDRRFIQDHKSPLESAFEVDFLYATDGALSRLESGQYGAILLCVETSENKGYALCMAIRRSTLTGDLKIALISAKASEEEYARHRGTKGKADLYLHKPITSSALIPALAEFVPMREDDPDNPLGDLGGADLGDEWLDSLRSELEVEGALPMVTPSMEPVPAVTFQMTPTPRVVVPATVWSPDLATDRQPIRNEGEIELLEWRVKDLELKLAAQHDELERKNHEIEDLIQRNAAVTRNLDEAQQSQSEVELLKRKILVQDDALGRLQDDLQGALDEQKRQVDQLEEVNVLLSEKTQQNADLMESHQLLQAQLEEAWEVGDRVRVLEGSLAEAQETARGHEARADAAEQARDGLKAELDGARAETQEALANLEARANQAEVAHAALQAERAETSARLQELEGAQGRIKELEEELNSTREQASFQELTIRNLAEERAGLHSDRDRREEELAALQENVSRMETSTQGVLKERDHLLELGQHLEQSVATLEKQVEDQAAAHENQQRELLAGIDERESHLVRLNSTLDSQRERLAQLEHDKEELETRIQGRKDQLQTITAMLVELEGKARETLDLAKAVTD